MFEKWVDGVATIIDKQGTKIDSATGWATSHEYVVDVQVPGEPVFRTTMKDPAVVIDFVAPDVGSLVPVHVDLKSQKAKWVHGAAQTSGSAQRHNEEAAAAAAHAANAALPAGSGSVHLPAAATSLSSDASAGTRVYSPAEMRQLQRTDPDAARAAMRSQGPAQPAQSQGLASSESTVDQLAKLADLRDRGVLTDEEFATQKAKILGAG